MESGYDIVICISRFQFIYSLSVTELVKECISAKIKFVPRELRV